MKALGKETYPLLWLTCCWPAPMQREPSSLRASSRARLFNDADRAQALPRTSAGDPEQARLREREDLQARVASLICNLGGIVALPLLLPLG